MQKKNEIQRTNKQDKMTNTSDPDKKTDCEITSGIRLGFNMSLSERPVNIFIPKTILKEYVDLPKN